MNHKASVSKELNAKHRKVSLSLHLLQSLNFCVEFVYGVTWTSMDFKLSWVSLVLMGLVSHGYFCFLVGWSLMDFKLNMIQNYLSDDGFGFKLNNMANINAFMINLHLVLAKILIGSATRIMGFFQLVLTVKRFFKSTGL